jgi:hypothetical protein
MTDDAPMDDKYVVFKREALDELLLAFANNLTPTVGSALNNFVEAVVEDAVVIRRQDIFAPPALEAYANGIHVALQLSQPGDEAAGRLQKIADYFHSQASEAWMVSKKVPD